LPAPVFRVTAEIQSRRRLGLTATLIREDGREEDVFSLIGPKKFDAPWKELESQGWIAPAVCTEVRVPMPARAPPRIRQRREAPAVPRRRTSPTSSSRCRRCWSAPDDHVLIIGQYLDQLDEVAERLKAPSSPERRHRVSGEAVQRLPRG